VVAQSTWKIKQALQAVQLTESHLQVAGLQASHALLAENTRLVYSTAGIP
jgi:hypothetical protein